MFRKRQGKLFFKHSELNFEVYFDQSLYSDERDFKFRLYNRLRYLENNSQLHSSSFPARKRVSRYYTFHRWQTQHSN